MFFMAYLCCFLISKLNGVYVDLVDDMTVVVKVDCRTARRLEELKVCFQDFP